MSQNNLDPSGPAQPSLNTAYTTQGNPATSAPAERMTAERDAESSRNAPNTDQRIPTAQSAGFQDATPSSLGYGVRGGGPGEERFGKTQEDVGRNTELEGEQMRASGEGDVTDAVRRKQGASGVQDDLASDLDRKKAEQAPYREEIQSNRQNEVDVAGILSNRGGPANPRD